MNFNKILPLLIVALASLLPDAAALNTARHSQASVLLPNGDFMVIGGVINNLNTPTKTTEIYFTSAAAWGSGGDITTARSSHTATLLSDGRVLVAGGFNADGAPLQSAEAYDTLTRSWAVVAAAMVSSRGGHTATLLSKGSNAGKVLICGGQDGTAATAITASCELFNPQDNSFTASVQMTSPRMGHTANLLPNGNVFASGGLAYSGGFIYLPTNELFVPETNQWRPAAALLEGRSRHSATVLNNGNVLIAGGFNGADQDDQFTLDPRATQIEQSQGTKGYLESVELFDPYGARVPLSGKSFDVMPYRNSSFGAMLRPDSSLRLTGGIGNIPVTYIPGSATVPTGRAVTFNLVPSGTYGIADVNGGTLDLQFNVPLSRKVTGRIIDGNIYFSPPADNQKPSLSIGETVFYLGRTTATLDAFPIRKDQYGDGGWLSDVITLTAPLLGDGATVVYPDVNTTAADTQVLSSGLNFSGPLVPAQSTELLSTSTMTLNNLIMTVPSIYEGGTMDCFGILSGGQIVNSQGLYTVGFTTGVATFTTGIVTGGGAVANNVLFTRLGGLIANTTNYNLNSGLNAAGQTAELLSLGLKCTGSFLRAVATIATPITFNADISTVVIREMVFSDDLGYDPSQSVWAFNKEIAAPKFNHNTLLTPAADRLDIGGRNCEASTGTYCLRGGTRRFDPIPDNTAYIFQNTAWNDGPKLNAKRAAHTSTHLADGSILTCGGSDGARTLQSCELLKRPGNWAYAGSMVYPRAAHTATLLPNGAVLMAGGTTGASTAAVNTAEIYYPDTRRLVLTTPMNEARMNHTATLLPDGNVLMVAGSSGTAYSNTSEVYITTAAKWQVIADQLGTARSQHTATLLKSGKILVTGGIAGFGAVNSAEVYDPLSRQWDPAPGNLIMPRYAHSANLLKDGRVLVTGGSNGVQALKTAEIFDGANWTYTKDFPGAGLRNDMLATRANHTCTLLPNGKVLVSGGEGPSVSRGFAEGYDVDLSTWQLQGTMQKRTNHTTILTAGGELINIGGFDGTQYLDTTDISYFTFTADAQGLTAAVQRQPAISTGTSYFDRASTVTLLSGTSNFHGITEASGGGAGPMNASYSNPRVYIQQIDNPSGFMIDLSTRIYSLFGGPNAVDKWEKTLSSITVIMPASAPELPYGWYHMRVAANGQFSNGHIVQVTVPRPTGLSSIPAGSVLGSTSVQWTWTQDTLSASDGYAIFASSDDVFIATTAFGGPGTYVQTGLAPNTAAAIKVGAYNTGGYSAFQKSATFYTLAVAPQYLTVNEASFETTRLSWDPMGNSPLTIYEVSMSKQPTFLPAEDVFIPQPFNNALTSTSTTISQLEPNQTYHFRVRARNMDGKETNYDNAYLAGTPASTVTVGNVNNLAGTPLTMAAINWSWDPSEGADFYEAYDITAGTAPSVFLASTTLNSLDQVNLSTNTAYLVAVNAVKNTGTGPIRGPVAASKAVYTLAVQPLPGVPLVFTNITTGTLTLNWIANGNSTATTYTVITAKDINLSSIVSSRDVTGTSTVLPDLTPNTRYYAGIIAVNKAGLTTPPVLLGSEYTKAQAPTNFRPTNISMSGITLAWNTGANPAGTIYEVRGTTTPGFTVNITTHVPFSRLNTSNSLTLNGLLTATTYYFDVAGMNSAGLVTARAQSVPPAYTLPGPSGAPGGSLGGTSRPGADATIEGALPNGRKVSLLLPAGSFESQTAIAISSFATNVCNENTVQLVAVEIFTQDNAQPQVPITLKLSYTDTEANAGITNNRAGLVLARYNEVTDECLPLETRIDPCFAVEGQWTRCITAKLNHFSKFQLMINTAAANLDAVRAYPNPFYTNRGQGFVTIDRLPASAKVRIYTLSGDKVWEGTAGTTGVLTWSAVNNSGVLVGSGVYLAAIESGTGKKVLKIAVER